MKNITKKDFIEYIRLIERVMKRTNDIKILKRSYDDFTVITSFVLHLKLINIHRYTELTRIFRNLNITQERRLTKHHKKNN